MGVLDRFAISRTPSPFADMALKATPSNHVHMALRLASLGSLYGRLYEEMKGTHDLDRAIEFCRMALANTTPEHSDRPKYLSNLGSWLHVRFKELNKQRTLTMQSVSLLPRQMLFLPPILTDHPF